jgi:hypothetical protein
MEIYIAVDGEGRWGLSLGIKPPEGSMFKKYDLGEDEITERVCRAYHIVSEYNSKRTPWKETELPDSLSMDEIGVWSVPGCYVIETSDELKRREFEHDPFTDRFFGEGVEISTVYRMQPHIQDSYTHVYLYADREDLGNSAKESLAKFLAGAGAHQIK